MVEFRRFMVSVSMVVVSMVVVSMVVVFMMTAEHHSR